MARRRVDVTTAWVLISSRQCTITIVERPETNAKRLLFNTSPDDEAATALNFEDLGRQVLVEHRDATYARADILGWGILIDD